MRLRILLLALVVLVLNGCVSENKAYPSHQIDSGKIFYDEEKVLIKEKGLFLGEFTGESMIPSLPPNSSLIFRKDFKSVNVGDIITFNATKNNCKNLISDTGIVAHRIVKIVIQPHRLRYITKGDGNKQEDDCQITLDKIEGLVVGVIY